MTMSAYPSCKDVSPAPLSSHLMAMHRWTTAAVGAVLAVALLTGCTGSDEPVPEPTSTRAPVPTDAPSTVEQWGFFAEEQKAQWDVWIDGWESVACGSVDQLESASIDCLVLVYQAAEMTNVAADSWLGLTTPGHAQFISTDPPAEVADLVAATQEAATAASVAGEEWVAANCGASGSADNCAQLSTTLGDALTAFDARLAEWQPVSA